MSHKEKMEWLKNNDPITYYEMTSNPTGADSDDFEMGCMFMILIVILIIGFILWFI